MSEKKEVLAAKSLQLGVAVASFKNVTEEESVSLTGDKIVRVWENQIALAERNKVRAVAIAVEADIEVQQELQELEQAYLDSFLDIDAKRVKTADSRKNFVEGYEDNISSHLNKLEGYKASIKANAEDLQDYLEQQDADIARYAGYLATLEKAIASRISK